MCNTVFYTKLIFGQPVSKDIVSDDRIKLTANDTIRYLNIPERSKNAIGGSEFANQVSGLSITEREKAAIK
ncbi:hypothetical protein [Wocania arenilitoris]|uniref:hypothetical protein n=1 Tax=Wocania arenilitoris TaxID=2044858 RepID=UPI001F3C6165|nr:hypothetical protein [Wocania arenilitoris]